MTIKGDAGIQIADGQECKVPSTIEDPTSLDVIQEAAKKIGYGPKK